MAASGASATSRQDTIAALFWRLASVAGLCGTGSRRLLGIKRAKKPGSFFTCDPVFLVDALKLLRDLFFGHGWATKHVSEVGV